MGWEERGVKVGVGGVEEREPGAERELPPPADSDIRDGESWLTTRARDLFRMDCLLAVEPAGTAFEAVRAALEPLSPFTSTPRSMSGSPVAARLRRDGY